METQANDYFATVGPNGTNQIAGDQLDETQKALEIGTVRAQAQQVSDRIIDETVLDVYINHLDRQQNWSR